MKFETPYEMVLGVAMFQKRKRVKPKPKDHYTVFTEADDRFIMEHYKNLGATRIAKELGLNYKSVWSRARKIGAVDAGKQETKKAI